MAEAIYDALAPLLTRWTMGGVGAPAAPPSWQAEVGSDPAEAELRLVALAGHFLGLAVLAEPQGDVRTLPDVPLLALPPIPVSLRPLARRSIYAAKERRNDILHFLAVRGRTMHPADWLPSAGDDEAPDIYAPWRDWANAAASANPDRRRTEERLSAANWDDYWPAARKAAFADLRRSDPQAAVALLQIKFASLGAEARLLLLGLLSTGLSEADIPFLQDVAGQDRAPKVKVLAASLLARLGQGSGGGEDATELAGFFELYSRGLLRRSQAVKPAKVKTPAQQARRRALFAAVDFAAFAGALGLAPGDLPGSWDWGQDAQADAEMAAMAEQSADDSAIAAFVEALREHAAHHLPALLAIASRLDQPSCAALAQQVLRGGGNYQAALALGGGACRIDRAIDMPAGAAVLRALAQEAAKPNEQAAELEALGLLVSRAGARDALERLTRAGLLHADPRLDLLRLNAALNDHGGDG